MEALQEELERADLRSRNEVLAEITGIEGRETGDGTKVDVTYEFVDEDSGVEVTSTDTFEMPSVEEPQYDFVRICQDLYVPLESAHEDLPGMSVPIAWDGHEWAIAVPEQTADGGGESGESQVNSLFGAVLDTENLLLVALFVVYPLVSPLVFLHLWPRRGAGRALAVTLGILVVWVGCAFVLVRLGVGPL